jgi:hypothetical protein
VSARAAARRAARPVPLLVLLATAACAPVLWRGVPWGHDTRPHLLWSHAFAEQLAAGELYPRWLLDVSHGFGAPVFFVYPPLTYYVTAAVAPITPGPELLPWRLGITAWLAVVASALAMCAWLRRHVGRPGAAFGAALYTLLPYHLIVDLHIRVALAELVAFTWPPLVLAALDGAHERPARALALGALAAGALFLTHAPTALVALPLPLAWSLVQGWRTRSARPPLVALGQVALGAGLAGAYLATALSHGTYIDESGLYAGQYRYDQWFLRLDEPRLWVRLVFANAAALAAACVTSSLVLQRVARRARPAPGLAPLVHAGALAAAVLFFFMLPQSAPLWERLPLLARIQFPWRLSAPLVLVASACLAGVFAQALRASRARPWRVAGPALALLALLLAANLVLARETQIFDRHLKPLSRERVAKLLREQRSQPEHWVPRRQAPDALFPGDERVAFVSGAGRAAVEEWSPRHIRVQVEAEGPVRVALRQQHYPGWRAEVAGRACCADLGALREEYGILALDLPGGSHRVSFTLGPTPNERMGWLASGASSGALLATGALARWGGRSRRTPAPPGGAVPGG